MKTNLKSGNAIVRLLLAHGEKIGILTILICTGLVVWSALGRERLEREPSQLDTLATEARQKIVQATWQQLRDQEVLPGEERPIIEAVQLPPSVMVKIKDGDFPNYTHPLNPPLSDPISLRTDPLLLAVTDLEVNADSGLWTSADPERINKKRLDAERERQEEEREREAARERAEREGDGRRGVGGEALSLIHI